MNDEQFSQNVISGTNHAKTKVSIKQVIVKLLYMYGCAWFTA